MSDNDLPDEFCRRCGLIEPKWDTFEFIAYRMQMRQFGNNVGGW